MGKLTKKITSIILTLSLPLACALQNVTPVEATGDSSDSRTATYLWHKAETLDDLKGEWDDSLGTATESYKGKWIPIIIVAEYPDGSKYYMNRNVTYANAHSKDSYVKIPQLTVVSKYSGVVGATLYSGIESGTDFYSIGDLGAMHMYYHGNVSKSFRVGRYGDDYKTTTADAWSLSSDANLVDENATPSTVLGVSGAQNKWTLDINEVATWRGVDDIPDTTGHYRYMTTGYGYTYDEQTQAWTFLHDYTKGSGSSGVQVDNGHFNVANFFGHGPYYNAHYYTTWIPLWGSLGKGDSDDTEKPYAEGKEWIDTPYLVQNRSALLPDESGEPVKSTEFAETAARNINSFYSSNSEDDTGECRAKYSIYIGKKIASTETSDNFEVGEGGETRLTYGSVIGENATITVKKGGTLYISRDASVYLNGNIINYGTVIIESGASVGMQGTPSSYIDCEDGGKLVIMEDAIVDLGNKLILKNGSVCINNGRLVTTLGIEMQNSRMEIGGNGEFLPGILDYYRESVFSLHGSDVKKLIDQSVYKPGNVSIYSGKPTTEAWTVDSDSKVILQENGKIYRANYVSFPPVGQSENISMWDPKDGDIQGLVLGKTVQTKDQYSTKNSAPGTFNEYYYYKIFITQ